MRGWRYPGSRLGRGRQVTDPLCKVFSMGRNLFCVHSKKRLDDIPELKAAKQKQNRTTLVQMGKKFNQVSGLLTQSGPPCTPLVII